MVPMVHIHMFLMDTQKIKGESHSLYKKQSQKKVCLNFEMLKMVQDS